MSYDIIMATLISSWPHHVIWYHHGHHSTILYEMIWYNIILYSMILYSMIQHDMICLGLFFSLSMPSLFFSSHSVYLFISILLFSFHWAYLLFSSLPFSPIRSSTNGQDEINQQAYSSSLQLTPHADRQSTNSRIESRGLGSSPHSPLRKYSALSQSKVRTHIPLWWRW